MIVIGEYPGVEQTSDGEVSSRTTPKLTENPVERALLDLANQQAKPRGVVRALAGLLETRRFDWRDLVRALGRIEVAARPAIRQPESETQIISAVARVALLAMRRAMWDTSGSRLQQAFNKEDEPDTILRKVFAAIREIIDFDIATYVEYQGGTDESAPTLARARFAVDGSKPFTWPARWVEIDPALVKRMKGSDRLIPDLNEFYNNQTGAKELRNNPVAQHYKKRGAHSVVSVPRNRRRPAARRG